jgi:hypothetical protein
VLTTFEISDFGSRHFVYGSSCSISDISYRRQRIPITGGWLLRNEIPFPQLRIRDYKEIARTEPKEWSIEQTSVDFSQEGLTVNNPGGPSTDGAEPGVNNLLTPEMQFEIRPSWWSENQRFYCPGLPGT